MNNKVLKPVIDYKKFFPEGVTMIDSINASEISSVTMTTYRPYTDKDTDRINWSIKIKLKNGSETVATFSNLDEALNAQKLIHSLHFRSMTFIYVIRTRSRKTFVSDIITNSSFVFEEAINHLD
jgi:hypothetical protein